MSADRYLQRIRACHTIDDGAFVPWFVAGHEHAPAGRVHRDRAALLQAPPTPFARDGTGRLVLRGDGFAGRSAAIAALVDRLVAERAARPPLGELYAVALAPAAPPLLQLDRCVVPWFGIRASGVHLNGFVRTAAGVSMWVATRARGKRTFPGHLDNLVAGGQSIGWSARATLQKECGEEAGIAPDLAARAVATGELHYVWQDGQDCKADTLHCFDLELPAAFVPQPIDGEVEGFALWPLPAVAASLCSPDAWKPNCALVAIDFLLRHGGLDGLDGAARARLLAALAGEPG